MYVLCKVYCQYYLIEDFDSYVQLVTDVFFTFLIDFFNVHFDKGFNATKQSLGCDKLINRKAIIFYMSVVISL